MTDKMFSGEDATLRPQELCESRGGRPGLPSPKGPYGLRGCKATLNLNGETEERSFCFPALFNMTDSNRMPRPCDLKTIKCERYLHQHRRNAVPLEDGNHDAYVHRDLNASQRFGI